MNFLPFPFCLQENQNEILKRLGLDREFQRDYVSKWERGVMEPPLHVLCAYADICNVYLDVLVRDYLVLPQKLPTKVKSAGLKSEDN